MAERTTEPAAVCMLAECFFHLCVNCSPCALSIDLAMDYWGFVAIRNESLTPKSSNASIFISTFSLNKLIQILSPLAFCRKRGPWWHQWWINYESKKRGSVHLLRDTIISLRFLPTLSQMQLWPPHLAFHFHTNNSLFFFNSFLQSAVELVEW